MIEVKQLVNKEKAVDGLVFTPMRKVLREDI